MLDCIATNETRFFREPRQFEFLEREVLPAWIAAAAAGRRARRIRAWSAGCSTGEEPYSLAMTLLAHCPPSAGWEVEVVATDLSTRALEKAKAAVWPVDDAREIPAAYLKRFMLRGVRAQAGSHEGRPRDPERGPLSAHEPQPGPLSGPGAFRPRLLPQRAHLFRRRPARSGSWPASRTAWPPGGTCSSATPRA